MKLVGDSIVFGFMLDKDENNQTEVKKGRERQVSPKAISIGQPIFWGQIY